MTSTSDALPLSPRRSRTALLGPAFALLTLLPLAAQADEAHCPHSTPRELQLELEGVRTVRFEIGASKLRLDATSNATGLIQGRACASSTGALDGLRLEQQRDGDQLTVRLQREGLLGGLFFAGKPAYLDLAGSVPDSVLVQLVVGSGDAWLTGAAAMSADVGSGDVDARGIGGLVTAKVGSGDITLHDIGELHVLTLGSGDIEARQVRGHVEVGSIGSGDASLDEVRGNVTVGAIGSGDLDVRGVGGDLHVRGVGSGRVRHAGVAGNTDVPRRR